MAASDPQGSQKYWFNGLPFAAVNKSGNDPGTEKFWFNGLPLGFLFPASAATPQGWISESPIVLAKKYGAHQQQFSGHVPQGPIYSITPQGWISEPPVILARQSAAPQYQDTSFSPQQIVAVETPYLGFAEWPWLLIKPFNAAQQQHPSFVPQGPIYSITPQGWISESPMLLTKPFGVQQQQVVAFAPQGAIYSITPQGWTSESPHIRVKGYPAWEQEFSSTFEPQPLVPAPLFGFLESPNLLIKFFNSSEQQAAAFAPRGDIVSVTPQGWPSESPFLLTKQFSGTLQQVTTFPPSGPIYSITPQGWASPSPDIFVRVAASIGEQQLDNLEPEPPFFTPWGWVSESPSLLNRPTTSVVEQQLDNIEPVQPFISPWGWSTQFPEISIKTNNAALAQFSAMGSFQSTVTVNISFTASPEAFIRPLPISDQQLDNFEPGVPFFNPWGWNTESAIVRTKVYLDLQFSSFAPFVTTAEVGTPHGWEMQYPNLLAKHFPAHEQQFSTYTARIFVRLAKGPSLLASLSSASLRGFDVDASFTAKKAAPGIKATDSEASLLAIKSDINLKADPDT